MTKPRRLTRRTQAMNDKGSYTTSKMKTYQFNKKKFKENNGVNLEKEIKNQARNAKSNQKYKLILDSMKIKAKMTKSNYEVMLLMLEWGFELESIETFLISSQSKLISQDEFKKVRFTDRNLKYKLTQILERESTKDVKSFYEALRGLHDFSSNLWLKELLNHAGSMPLLNLSHERPIWVSPQCDASMRHKKLVGIMVQNPIQKLRTNLVRLINNWNDQLFNTQKTKSDHGTNPDYKQSCKLLASFDCEWGKGDKQFKRGISTVKERNLDDVLSFQMTAMNPETGEINRLTVHNDSKQHFQFSELLIGLLQVVEPIAPRNDDGSIPYNLKITLLGYWSGVDISCFAGWETRLRGLLVLHKNFIFSPNPLPFFVRSENIMASKHNHGDESEPNQNEFKLSLKFVDVGLIAPAGGLSALGEAVGIPKLDTRKWSVEDGYEPKYYKENMDQLRINRPDDYLRYAQLDADITLKYYRMVTALPFFQSWLQKPPATIGSFGAGLVFNTIKESKESLRESIFDNSLSSGDIANSKGVMGVKRGQAELFKLSIISYFGGYNTAFTSGIFHGRIIDTDLVSAYVLAGLMLPLIDFDNSKYRLVTDSQLKVDWLNEPLHVTEDNDFNVIYDLMKDLPFIAGTIECVVDLPDDIKISTTPFQSTNKEYGPCYVKHGKTTITLLDAFNVVRMGGTVKIIDGYIPAQCFKGLSAFGKVQAMSLDYRNVAKANKKQAFKDGNMLDYHRYEVEQLTFKLLGNSIYGKTGQGTSSTKRSRDFETYETEDINYSSITNPVIAGLYTAITRYLVTILFESVDKVCNDVVPLNITTDGYTFKLPENANFDEDAVRKEFLSHVPDLYKARVAQHFNGVVNGFELKGNVVDKAFNLKTRVNGTVNYDDSNGGIQALASMHGYSNSEIYNKLINHQYQVVNKETRISNLTEMKHHVKNHYGHQETWEQQKLVNLQYDFAFKPNQFIDHGLNQYVTTLPFSTVEEHDNFKKLGMMVTKNFPIEFSNDNFNGFMLLMNSNATFKKSDVKMSNFRNYCLKHYVSSIQNRVGLDVIYNLTDQEGLSRSTIRNFIKRHKPDDNNINYLASWFWQNIDDFSYCELPNNDVQ